mmetsp:Transcript_48450/g.157021  ORF Transcript_48450/g.157021 Transcript_48450/m.157021 type:complete len:253 (+) Transcript_48450:238-996(+)
MALKRAPSSPPATPIRTKTGTSRTLYCSPPEKFGMRTGGPSEAMMPVQRPEKSHATESAATMAAKKARHVRDWLQCVLTSSSEKRTPPIGALKAAATPAAAPIETRSRRWRSSSRMRTCAAAEVQQERESSLLCHRSTSRPMPAPSCTIGPSRPQGRPEATTRVMPASLTRRVRAESAPGTRTPLSSTLTIGMPEPHAAGAQSETAAAPAASATQSAVKSGYARMAPNGKLSSQKVMPHLARSSSSAQALDT